MGDDEYAKGIPYLIQNGVTQIPSPNVSVEKSSKISSWVKNDVGYWADGSLGDTEYVSAIQYLVGMGVIDVNTLTVSNTATSSTSTSSSSATDADHQSVMT